MPRRALLACAGVVALLMSGTVIPKSLKAQVVQAGGVTVNVDIRCLADNGVSFSILPWTAELAQGDTIAWKLDRNAGVQSIDITPKQGGGWPFNDHVSHGNAANAPRSKSMKPNQLRKKYAYSIVAECKRADGSTSSINIDPDMIIVH